MRLALYEPDIPQNCGALLRLGACLGIVVDIIEPCGFVFSDKGLKRAGMDYLERAEYAQHASWDAFLAAHGTARILLLTSKGDTAYTNFAFAKNDTILLGRESAGVPDAVHNRAMRGFEFP